MEVLCLIRCFDGQKKLIRSVGIIRQFVEASRCFVEALKSYDKAANRSGERAKHLEWTSNRSE